MYQLENLGGYCHNWEKAPTAASMTGLEPLIATVTGIVFSTIQETAKEESGSTLAKWLNKDIGKAAEQALFRASGKYVTTYQKRHGTLKVVCVRMDAPMELEDIYTPVQLLKHSDLQYFESADALETGFRKRGRRFFGVSSASAQDGIAVVNQEQYLMVLGRPGVGKSTFLRKVGLEALKPQKAVGTDGYAISKYRHACVPVFLALQRFKNTDQTIDQRIAEEFAICGFPEPAAFTQAMLKQGKLLILFDGLDEVPQDQEDTVIEQIRDFVDRHDNNRFVTSCRIAAYKGGFPRFKDVVMATFDDAQIEQFIHSWFRTAKDQEHNTASQCWKLLQRPEYSAAKELAQTPLLLTLLCAVYSTSLELPKNRASLYGKALDVVLKEWTSEKLLQRNPVYQDFSVELERELLAEIAYDNFSENQLFFDQRDLTRRIKQFLVNNLNAPKHLDSTKILAAIEVQQGILASRARDTYSFSHLTFQEYLTAQHIVENQQIEWLVTSHLSDQRWQEVFLLVVGLLPESQRGENMLLLMAKQARAMINTPKLEALLRWATEVTDGSEGDYKPAAKRLGAIALTLNINLRLALALNLNLARDLNLDRTLDRALNFTLKLICTLDHTLDRTLNLNYDRALARALARALKVDLNLDLSALDRVFNLDIPLDRARNLAFISALNLNLDFQKTKIFNSVYFADLVAQLEVLQSAFPDHDQPLAVRQAFVEKIQQLWFNALNLDPTVANLNEQEARSLYNCLYANDLMVRCKEAGQVSPEVWAGIEARMLTVSDS